MGLLFAAAVVLFIAALALRSAHPQRALVIGCLGLAGAATALALFLTDRDRDAPAPIATTELTLSDVALSTDRYGSQLTGHVRNGSARRLGTLTLTITYRQCAPDGTCKILGTETPRLFLALPPGQTGSFSTLLTQGALFALPGVTWDCAIASARTDF